MRNIRLSDIRKFIKKLKASGITIERPKYPTVPLYNKCFKTIVIPRKVNKKTRFKIPVIALYHEGGHALGNHSFDETTLEVFESIGRFKSNHRYSQLLAAIFNVSTNSNAIVFTQESEKMKILNNYRKLRRSLFLEMQANGRAMREMPFSFIKIYDKEVSKYFKLYRAQLLNCPYISSRKYFERLLKITEKHFV